jgi:hypothetical protein
MGFWDLFTGPVVGGPAPLPVTSNPPQPTTFTRARPVGKRPKFFIDCKDAAEVRDFLLQHGKLLATDSGTSAELIESEPTREKDLPVGSVRSYTINYLPMAVDPNGFEEVFGAMESSGFDLAKFSIACFDTRYVGHLWKAKGQEDKPSPWDYSWPDRLIIIGPNGWQHSEMRLVLNSPRIFAEELRTYKVG